MNRFRRLAVVLLVTGPATCAAQTADDSAGRFAQWGVEALDAAQRDFWLADQGLYAEKVVAGGDENMQPAFMWGAGVQLTALAAAARHDSARYIPQLTAYADALEKYWIEHDGIGGYSVLPHQTKADRYYDDNVWIVLALVETMEATQREEYLKRAEATMRFVLSGEDDALGGGIYWRENRRTSKNTCSNAPAIVAALRLHQKTSDEQYLAIAERLYDWTRARLQDDEDGLFWDNVRLSGRIDRRKYSYNTALMIRANCLLFEIKRDPKFLSEAQRLAQAATTRWIVADTGAVKDGGRFAHLLLESLLAVGRIDGDRRWTDVVSKSLDFVHESVRDANGRYAHSWDERQAEPLQAFQLIDQASAARGYFMAAEALRNAAQRSGNAGE